MVLCKHFLRSFICLRRNFGVYTSQSLKDSSRIRNIGISAHIDSGKTTLTERVLFYAGKIHEMHEVKGKDKVGATMDSMELERQRGITIKSAATYVMWKNHEINIIDTPGHVDFTIEVERALRVLDAGILVICAVGGVQSQTLTVNRQLARYSVPTLIFINKVDRQGSNYKRAFQELGTKLNYNCAFLTVPITPDSNKFLDIVSLKSLTFQGTHGENVLVEAIPAGCAELASQLRKQLVECLANVDETFSELYIEDKNISEEDLRSAIRRTCIARTFFPVFVGSALKNKGVQPLLDAVVSYLPDPTEISNYALRNTGEESSPVKVSLDSDRLSNSPLVALIFKLETRANGDLTYVRIYQGSLLKGDTVVNTRTNKRFKINRIVRMHSDKMIDVERVLAGDIFALLGLDCASGDTLTNHSSCSNLSMESLYVPDPVVSMSIMPTQSTNVELFNKALKRFCQEDPTFHTSFDNENKQFIVEGMGELHLEIYAQRMEREYNTPCTLGKPKVSYKEMICEPFEFSYLHKKQTGGAGQFAKVIGVIEPLPIAKCLRVEFSDETVGNNIPSKFISGIKKSVYSCCLKGPLIGRPITGIRFRLLNGDNHSVDSSDLAFSSAVRGAFITAFEFGKWMILEPITRAEIICTKDYQNEVMQSMMKKSAIIHNTSSSDDYFMLTIDVPLMAMFNYTSELRSITRGLGEFSMEYLSHSPIPPFKQDALIEEHETNFKSKVKSKK